MPLAPRKRGSSKLTGAPSVVDVIRVADLDDLQSEVHRCSNNIGTAIFIIATTEEGYIFYWSGKVTEW